MGRNPSVDWVALKREYIYSEPPISLTDLAEKHDVARSALAAKAAGGKGDESWFDARKEFRSRLDQNTMVALADKWVAFEAENREKRMQTANAVLDNFLAQLAPVDDAGQPLPSKIKIGPKDALEWVKLMRDEFEDMRNIGRKPEVIEGEAVEMSEETARRLMAEAVELLEAGSNGTEPGS